MWTNVQRKIKICYTKILKRMKLKGYKNGQQIKLDQLDKQCNSSFSHLNLALKWQLEILLKQKLHCWNSIYFNQNNTNFHSICGKKKKKKWLWDKIHKRQNAIVKTQKYNIQISNFSQNACLTPILEVYEIQLKARLRLNFSSMFHKQWKK